MAKKKFTGGEAHLIKLLNKKNKELKEVKNINSELTDQNLKLSKQVEELEELNKNYTYLIEELQKINKLSDDEIKELIKSRAALQSVAGLLTNKSLFGGTYL